MQPDRRTERTEWCWFYGTRDTEKDTDMQPCRRIERKFYGTRDTEKDTDMQPDRRTVRTEWCWFHVRRDTERIQICS